ncbi:MAG: hypothetical protein KKD11_06830 [Candidatus Omnitrophica bacterium]|nr:hypothetical protein [Candidatus Omnitrophota bacterium]
MKPKQKILLILFGFIITFFVLEVGLRLGSYFYYFYRARSSVDRSINEDAVRILCIGDSFTFGVGGTEGHSYPEQLEKILNKKNPLRRFVVYNCGIPGANSSMMLRRLPGWLSKYRPHFVITMAGLNNSWNLSESNYFLFRKGNAERNTYYMDYFCSRSQCYKFFKILALNLKSKIHIMRDLRKDDTAKNKAVLARETMSLQAEDHFTSGQRHLKYRAFSSAIEEFKKTLKINPCYYPTYLMLADIYSCKDNCSYAEKLLRKAIKIDPFCIQAYDALWKIYWHEGRKEEAMEVIKIALKLDPSNRDLLYVYFCGLPSSDNCGLSDKILKYDLENIIKLSKINGAKVVLQTYPKWGYIPEILKEIVAGNKQIIFVDNVSFFERLKSSKDYKNEDYFVEDGHCNDHGYQMMAENLYRRLKNELGVLI